MRLEDLFDRMQFFVRSEGAREHHIALITLFEALEVSSRADLKVDLLQELERQRQTLLAFRNNPDISEEALSGALYEIEQASSSLLAMAGKVGQYLRDNEWLMSIKSRTHIPGGVCEFDLPAYHFWRNRDAAARIRDLEGWMNPLLPIRDAVAIVLRLLRSSGRAEKQEAVNGLYQQAMGGRNAQMLRLRVPRSHACTPEISANKYALNIRFSGAEAGHRPRQVECNVAFELTFCNL